MKKIHILLSGLLLTLPFTACLYSSEKNGVAAPVSSNLISENLAPPQNSFLALSPEAMQHQVDLEMAASKRTVAQDRCFGMVGAAKNVCLSEADDMYGVLVHLADSRLQASQVASLSVTEQ